MSQRLIGNSGLLFYHCFPHECTFCRHGVLNNYWDVIDPLIRPNSKCWSALQYVASAIIPVLIKKPDSIEDLANVLCTECRIITSDFPQNVRHRFEQMDHIFKTC